MADRAREGDLVFDLAVSLRELVAPLLGGVAGRAHARSGAGGDVTFEIDARAEDHLAAWIASHAPGVAFYSEDRGLAGPEDASLVLVVDPIDGTRPALAGLESCCASVALAPAGAPCMGDVLAGAIVEIKTGDWFVAERGGGCTSSVPLSLSSTVDLDRLFWVYGLRGRPSRVLVEVLGDLIDGCSVGGGTFELGSATFGMTRVLTGQLDAYIEPSPRIVSEVPGTLEEFLRVGRGTVLNNSPYDLAAATICLREGGAQVTDAAGRSLADRPLLGSGADFQMSVVASASPELHGALIDRLDRGIARLLARPAG